MARNKKCKMNFNTFMCIQCGNSVYSLPRPASHQYKDGHRKVLYCPHCKEVMNCVECRNDTEVFNFKMTFEQGGFENERQNFVDYGWRPGSRKVNIPEKEC